MLNGEVLSGLIWWEGKDDWNEVQVPETNTWPPDTEIETAWAIKNMGDEAAYFKVSFMGLESAAVLLNPGEEAWVYLYPVTPSAGTYDYTLELIANDQVVSEYPVKVVTGEGIPGILPLVLIGGLGVVGVGAALALAPRRE